MVGGVDKGGVGGVDIEVGKKAGVVANASTDSSADGDGDGRAIDQRADLESVAIAALPAVDNAENSNLAIPDGPHSGTATSTSDKFLATFAALANTTFERETNICKSTPSGFICRKPPIGIN